MATSAVPPAGDEDADGYGFFAPVPAATPAAMGVLPEEGDGYGFFAPLPALPAGAVEALSVPETQQGIETGKTPARETMVKALRPHTGGSDSSIRVSVEKVDQLINLVLSLIHI